MTAMVFECLTLKPLLSYVSMLCWGDDCSDGDDATLNAIVSYLLTNGDFDESIKRYNTINVTALEKMIIEMLMDEVVRITLTDLIADVTQEIKLALGDSAVDDCHTSRGLVFVKLRGW